MTTATPSIPNWSPVDAPTSIAGHAVWLFRTTANIVKVPAFTPPAGYETLFPPVAGAGTRAYAALRQLQATASVVKADAPAITQWTPFDVPTAIAGAIVWGYRSAPNLKAAPPLAVPQGWELLVPAVNGGVTGGTRYYAAIRPSAPAPLDPAPAVVEASTPIPTPEATKAPTISYAVAASEVLFLTSQVSVDGVLQPRRWSFQNATKDGYNCGFWIEPATLAGQFTLVESDVTGANPIIHTVNVTADPYTTVSLAADESLAPLIEGAPDLTRYVLAANADYVITTQPFAARRLQLVGQSGTIVTIKPSIAPGAANWNGLFAVWLTAAAAKVGLVNLIFVADTGGKLNSQGKTSTGAAYVPIGSLWAVNCTFSGMDLGIQADSTGGPNGQQADGILVQSCRWPDLYGQGVWIAGQIIDVDSCQGGPSKLEHPIRSSIVNLTTNQLPTFVRVAGCTFDATHASATTADPGKESAAFRDGRYFHINGNTFIGWVECGQGTPNAWDYFGEYVFDANVFVDPVTAPNTGTLHVRAGVNGPGVVSNSSAVVPIVVTAAVPPEFVGNKP